MNRLLCVLFFLLLFKAHAQDTVQFDAHNWKAPYDLQTPEGWGTERFAIPMSFAPDIHYKGVEDIRFTPGWSKKESPEYWSYVFLWYLDSTITFDSKIIESNLSAYYTGLLHANLDIAKMTSEKVPRAKVKAKRTTSRKGDLSSFDATVQTLDFLTWQPLVLHLRIYVKSDEQKRKTFVFHEVSPKPYDNEVWRRLHNLWTAFLF